MGSVADSWREFVDDGAVRDYSDIPFGELVEVAALLKGQRDAKGTAWDRPPLALRLWLRGRLIMFSFSSKDFPLCLWGSAKALDAGLLTIEEAICKEHCDWRKNQFHENGFTHNKR